MTAGCAEADDLNNCRAGLAQVWDAGDGRLVSVLEGHTDEISQAWYSLDGSRIVTASWDGTARIWDASDGHALLTLPGITALFSPDGTRIVTASADGTLRLWKADADELLVEQKVTEGSVESAEFSADGVRLVTVTNLGVAEPWNADDGTLIAVLQESSSTEYVRAARFNRAGTRLVTTGCAKFSPRTDCSTGIARLWDLSGNLLVTSRAIQAMSG